MRSRDACMVGARDSHTGSCAAGCAYNWLRPPGAAIGQVMPHLGHGGIAIL